MKNTKKALLLSVMSLLVCVSMLVGTTFAWFTDSVSTGMNTINAGNLDVDVVMEDGTSIMNVSTLFSDVELWEPGVVAYENLTVKNLGSLALKYQLAVNFGGENTVLDADGNDTGAKLSQVLKVAMLKEHVATNDREALIDSITAWESLASFTEEGKLLPVGRTIPNAPADATATEQAYALVIWWEPSAEDNKWNLQNGKTTSDGADSLKIDLGIQLAATQLMAEDDSFGNDYDEDADYAVQVATLDELNKALAYGGNIALTADITLPEGEKIQIPEGTTVNLDLGGKTVSGGYQAGSTSKHVYPIENRGTLTLENGTVNGRGVSNYGDLTIESGTYNAIDTNGGGAIWNYAGKVTVNGGTFTAADATSAPAATLVNVAAGSSVTINGGTFKADANQTYGIISNGTLVINDINISADHGVISSNGDLTINGGTFKQNGNLVQTSSLLYITNGTTKVTGGTFNFNVGGKLDSGLPVYCAGGSVAISGGTFTGYVTEMIDSWGGTGTASVTGGTFAKKPAYIADGHAATQNADGTWTVAREYNVVTPAAGATKEENGAALADAIVNSTTPYVQLGAGEYKMPSVTTAEEFTIVGTKDTVIDNTMGAYLETSKVSFEGVTIKGSTGKANGNGSDYAALYATNVTYTNCTFDGPFRIGRDGATFIDCTFTNLGNDYVWNYGNDCTFIGCVFETEGKALLMYNDGGSEVAKVTVKDCVFNSTKGAKAGAIANQNCAAIEIDNYGNGVDLTTSGNTYDSNFSGEWRIKSHNGTANDVLVNGVEYTTIAIDGKLMTIDAAKNVTVID